MPFFDLTLPTLVTRIVVLLPLLAAVGLAVAGAARLMGDEGPAQDGRLTANPAVHLDMLGALGFVALGLGWAKPVDLAPERLKGGRAGVLAVIAAGALAPLLLAIAAVLLLPFAARITSGAGVSVWAAGLAVLARQAVGFALFNLLPVLPLVAGYLLDAFLPAAARWLRERPVLPGLVLLALLATGLPQRLLDPVVGGVLAAISGNAGALVSGY